MADLNRRKLLQAALNLGLLGIPGVKLLSSRASSQVAGGMSLVNFEFSGAPARWVWDSPNILNPQQEAFLGDIWGTRFIANADGNYNHRQEYLLHKFSARGSQFYLPHMWSFSLPTATGSDQAMTNLASNMMVIRGINSFFADHIGARSNHFSPQGASRGLLSLQGDFSSNIFPYVVLANQQVSENSKNGRLGVKLGAKGDNPISALSDASPSSSWINNQNSVKRISSLLNKELAVYGGAEAPLTSAESIADQMKITSFGDVDALWTQLYSKYKNLIAQSLARKLPGILDKQIINNQSMNLHFSSPDVAVSGNDYRSVLPEGAIEHDDMARKFAILEYLMVNNDFTGCCNLTISTGINSGGSFFKLDEHNTGSVVSLIANTYLFFAFSSCLNEFIGQLKQKSMFDKTIVSVSSEFGRTGQKDGGGSSHNSLGKSISMFSGAIDGPQFIGETKRFGEGVSGFTYKEELVSMSTALKSEAPYSGVASLLQWKDGKLVPK